VPNVTENRSGSRTLRRRFSFTLFWGSSEGLFRARNAVTNIDQQIIDAANPKKTEVVLTAEDITALEHAKTYL
jgi:hypothetical protein